ncbi:hypothetical protein HDE_12836 [Halotydeus destructor]|nr:hypothetical protein HDE_12836 [Halotydeus destructor]
MSCALGDKARDKDKQLKCEYTLKEFGHILKDCGFCAVGKPRGRATTTRDRDEADERCNLVCPGLKNLPHGECMTHEYTDGGSDWCNCLTKKRYEESQDHKRYFQERMEPPNQLVSIASGKQVAHRARHPS